MLFLDMADCIYHRETESRNARVHYRVTVWMKLLFQECGELDHSQSRTSYAPPDPRRVKFCRFPTSSTGTKATRRNIKLLLHADTDKHACRQTIQTHAHHRY